MRISINIDTNTNKTTSASGGWSEGIQIHYKCKFKVRRELTVVHSCGNRALTIRDSLPSLSGGY